MSEGLFVVSKKTLSLDEAIKFPTGKWSGSMQFFSKGMAVLEIDGKINYPLEVDKGSIIEFHGLPITKLISKSDNLVVSVVATPTCEIPSITEHKALSEDVLESIDSRLEGIALDVEERVRCEVKADLINASITANTNILSEDITPSKSPSILRVQAAFNAEGVLSVVKTKDTTTIEEKLNGGQALSANSLYILSLIHI